MVRATRQHKPVKGIQIITRSNRITNKKYKKIPSPYFSFVSTKLLATNREQGMIPIATKSQRDMGNKDAQEWRVGSIHAWLRCCGSQVIMHLNMEMLDVTTEITCKVDGGFVGNE